MFLHYHNDTHSHIAGFGLFIPFVDKKKQKPKQTKMNIFVTISQMK